MQKFVECRLHSCVNKAEMRMRVFGTLVALVAFLWLTGVTRDSQAQGVVFVETVESQSAELSYRFSHVSRKGELRVLASVRAGPVVLLECNAKEIVYLDRNGAISALSLQGDSRREIAKTSLVPKSEMIGKTVLRKSERRLYTIEDQSENMAQKRSANSLVRAYGFDGSNATLITLRGRGVALKEASHEQLRALSEQETAMFNIITNEKTLDDARPPRNATLMTMLDGANIWVDGEGKRISVRPTGDSAGLKQYGMASSFAIVHDYSSTDRRVLFVDMDSQRGEDRLVELDENGRTNVLAKTASIGAACYARSVTIAK
ncbi:MAG: hypothetical protein ACRCWJ_10390 [Casimicrobium sp.]